MKTITKKKVTTILNLLGLFVVFLACSDATDPQPVLPSTPNGVLPPPPLENNEVVIGEDSVVLTHGYYHDLGVSGGSNQHVMGFLVADGPYDDVNNKLDGKYALVAFAVTPGDSFSGGEYDISDHSGLFAEFYVAKVSDNGDITIQGSERGSSGKIALNNNIPDFSIQYNVLFDEGSSVPNIDGEFAKTFVQANLKNL